LKASDGMEVGDLDLGARGRGSGVRESLGDLGGGIRGLGGGGPWGPSGARGWWARRELPFP